jgi:hypothetical protein
MTMPKGGARSRSGPPPDPNALVREHDTSEWVTLPAAGRSGPVPEWPLTDPVGRESELWAKVWAMPQAVMWEKMSQHVEVALYVRRLVEAEQPESKVTVGTLVRQYADSLGLTTPGLRSNRWRIALVSADDEEADQPARSSSKSRLRVVANGDGA